MANRNPSLTQDTSSTEGTSAYTLDQTVIDGRVLFADGVGVTNTTGYIAQDGVSFEVGEGTLTNATTLTRDEVAQNSLGTTAKINWLAGTRTIIAYPVSLKIAMVHWANIWLAAQYFNGQKLYLDEGAGSYIDPSTDNQLDFYINNLLSLRATAGSLLMRLSDNGAGVGPSLVLDRLSSSPAANDSIPSCDFQGRTSTAATALYARLLGEITSPTNGAHTGRLKIQTASGGSLASRIIIDGASIQVPAGNDLMASKTSLSESVVGTEIRNGGRVVIVTDNEVPLTLNHKNGSGTRKLMSVQVDNSEVASVTSASGVVTWGNFLGAHPAWWAPGHEPPEVPATGTAVCFVGGAAPLDIGGMDRETLVTIRLPEREAENTVYGTFAGMVEDTIQVNGQPVAVRYALVWAVGAGLALAEGPVLEGDLLWTSGGADCSLAAQSDDIWRAASLAKAKRAVPAGETALIPVEFR